MSTTTLSSSIDLGPLLVSDLPPAVAPQPTLLSRLLDAVRADLAARRESRAFYRAVRTAGHDEAGDLMALRRRA